MQRVKITTTLETILRHELKNRGHSEFTSGNHISWHDPDTNLISRILKFDDEIHSIVTNRFFLGFTLNTPEADKRFKHAWLMHFLDRQIGFQTVERFALKNSSVTRNYEDFLNTYYTQLEDYLTNKQTSQSESKGGRTTKHRQLETTLPQDTANMDINDDFFEYPDENRAWNEGEDNNENSTTTTSNLTLENLLLLKESLTDIFHEYDRRCFLQVW